MTEYLLAYLEGTRAEYAEIGIAFPSRMLEKHVLESYLASYPDDTYARYLYACLLYGKGNYECGIAEFEAIVAKEDNYRALRNLSMGYYSHRNDKQKALELMGFYALAKDENLLFERKVVCEEFYKDASQDERIEYHYDQMYETSDSLMRILYKSAINADSIKEFERIAISLKWEGRKARLFRRKVSELTAILRSCIPTDHNIQLLYKLAEYPRKCADEMYATEQKLIQMLNKI
jgi:hypothetical protein